MITEQLNAIGLLIYIVFFWVFFTFLSFLNIFFRYDGNIYVWHLLSITNVVSIKIDSPDK